MKKILKFLGYTLGVIILLVLAGVSYIYVSGIPKYEVQQIQLTVEVTPERVAQGQKIANMECVACHADKDGVLTGRLLDELPPEFGTIYSRNITQDPEVGIGSWTDGELFYLLRTGIKRDGQYIPPYMAKFPHASDEDIYSIIAWLRSDKMCVQPSTVEPAESEPSLLTKFLSRVAFKPLPYSGNPIPQPDTNDAVAHGKYLSTAIYNCYPCHSADFKTMNEMKPEKSGGFMGGGNILIGKGGEKILSTNITFDKTGIADYSEDDFIQVMRYGKKKDGSLTRYPMFPRPELTDKELKAIYAYLKTIPTISNDVKSIPLN